MKGRPEARDEISDDDEERGRQAGSSVGWEGRRTLR